MRQPRDKEKEKVWYKARYQKNRIKILELLGGKCVKCNLSDYDCLQIDHIKPIKMASGKRMPNNGMFFHILNGKIPKHELQVLCANCHMKKTVLELREGIQKDTHSKDK